MKNDETPEMTSELNGNEVCSAIRFAQVLLRIQNDTAARFRISLEELSDITKGKRTVSHVVYEGRDDAHEPQIPKPEDPIEALGEWLYDIILDQLDTDCKHPLCGELASDRTKYEELYSTVHDRKEQIIGMMPDDLKNQYGECRWMDDLLNAQDAVAKFMAVRAFYYGVRFGESDA